MTWEIAILVISTAGLTAGAVLGVCVWYVRKFVREFQNMEKGKKREAAIFLKTSIEHMEALHAGTARQIAVLKEHARKLESEAQ